MIILKILFIYSLIAILFYFILALLINANQGIDPEVDEAFSDRGARAVALLFSSALWPISIILIIYNNLKGDLKNGKSN